MGVSRLVVFLQRFQDRAGGHFQLGQAAPVIFHLLDEFERSEASGQDSQAAPGVIAAKAARCFGSNSSDRSRVEEFPVDPVGVRLQ